MIMDACGFCFSFCQRSFQAVLPRYKPLSYVDLPLGLSEKARSTLQCPTEFGQLSFQIQVSTVSLRYKANIIKVPNGPNIFSKWHGMRWAYMVVQAFRLPKERFNLKKMKCHVAFALVITRITWKVRPVRPVRHGHCMSRDLDVQEIDQFLREQRLEDLHRKIQALAIQCSSCEKPCEKPCYTIPIGSMVLPYMVIFTINIPQLLAYIP